MRSVENKSRDMSVIKESCIDFCFYTYRPLALQGIVLSPEHIQAWKQSISEAEARHTSLVCDILETHLNHKSVKTDSTIANMTARFQSEPNAETLVNQTLEVLTRKGAKCRAQAKIKTDVRKEKTSETSRLFSVSTNIARLPRTAYTNTSAPPKRKSSRSSSRSRARGPNQVQRPRETPNNPRQQATTTSTTAQPTASTSQPQTRGVTFAPNIDRDAIARIVDQAIQQYINNLPTNMDPPRTYNSERYTNRPPPGRGHGN